MYDLPSEEIGDSGLPDEFHIWQARLLSDTFCPPSYSEDQVLVASDLNLYYDPRHTQWYKRPDWFAVVGIPKLYEERYLRLSYVIWQEGVAPFVAVEFLSPGTEKEDLGQTLREAAQPPTKWQVYEQILQIPYYLVFNRYTDELQAFRLEGRRYRALDLEQSRVWMSGIELGIGLWQGSYENVERQWLRWFNASGQWIPTPPEREANLAEQERQRAEQERQRAERERQRAEQERQRAEQERRRSERLLEQLRSLGIEPDLET